MSDPRVAGVKLARSQTQLPAASYFDPELFEREMAVLFARTPSYVGHELAVPEVGDFHALPHEGEGRVLVRTPQGVRLLSNVCRHRQAIMLRGRGHTGSNIVCPLHRWTYGLQGQLVGAPHFADDPCRDLASFPLQSWNGMLFEPPAGTAGGRDIAAELSGVGAAGDLDFTGYAFDSFKLHECDYNWKTFIEVYLEDYHVAPFHPGLGQFVTCEDLRWEFGRHHSVQTVGPKNELAKPGSPAYRKWHDAVLAYREGRFADPVPRHGAIWLTSYPATMVEWYPHVLVVSTLYPRGPRKTLNLVEFYYPEDIHAFEREFVEAEQAAYWETCAEDDEIALRMDAGRQALHARGEDDFGPYQSPMEDGMQQFHEWYWREMEGGTSGRT
jgi:phenylpropionate dioxygenase-like ring-hydroxylating dioxygenase large terminal subunit